MDEWLNKLRYTTEHYLAIKGNGVLICAIIRTNLKNVMKRRNKPGAVGHILFVSICAKCPEQTLARSQNIAAEHQGWKAQKMKSGSGMVVEYGD